MLTIKNTKLQYLLDGLDDKYKNNFRTDKVGLYSISKFTDADYITKQIIKICDLNNYKSILDLTSCVGGNLINFCLYFNKCIGLEINEKRYKYLKHNLKLFDNVKLYNIDCIKYIHKLYKHLLKINILKKVDDKYIKLIKDYYAFDVIFFDPPWGGEDYKNIKSLSLYLNENININKVIQNSLILCKYIVCKLPKNYNFDDMKQFNIIHKEKIYTSKESFYYFIIIEDI